MKALEGRAAVRLFDTPDLHSLTLVDILYSSNTAVNLTLAVQASSQYQVTAGGTFVTPNYICESCFGRSCKLLGCRIIVQIHGWFIRAKILVRFLGLHIDAKRTVAFA